MTKDKKGRYWVQTIYAVIAPDGSAEDYFYTRKEAITEANKWNAPLPLKKERKIK